MLLSYGLYTLNILYLIFLAVVVVGASNRDFINEYVSILAIHKTDMYIKRTGVVCLDALQRFYIPATL